MRLCNNSAHYGHFFSISIMTQTLFDKPRTNTVARSPRQTAIHACSASNRRDRRWPWLLLALLVSTPVLAEAENNPGNDRPGLGFNPAVPQAGDFAYEQGLPSWSRNDGVTLYTADTLLRLGLGHSLEVQLGTGWNRLRDSGTTTSGRSDTSLAIKFAPKSEGSVRWGVLGSVELTDGAQAFRANKKQYLMGAVVNWQRSETHALGAYVEAVHGDTNSQLLAINTNHQLTDTLGLYVEAAVQHRAGMGHGSMGGGGLAWQVTPRVQLDVGVRHRLGGNADTWQGFAGISFYFGD
jgi:hypothetical protein